MSSNKSLVVVGSANADIYIEVQSVPKVGETVDGVQSMIGPGGKGSNQAGAAAKYLDAAKSDRAESKNDVFFVGKVGTDGHGDMFLSAFANCGVNTQFVTRHTEHPTGQAFIILDASSHNSIIIALGANEQWPAHADSGAALSAAEAAAVASAGAVLLQREIPDTVNLAVARAAAAARVPAMLDVGGRASAIDTAVLPYLALISLNETELARVAGADVPLDILSADAVKTMAATDGNGDKWGVCEVDPTPILPAAAALLSRGVRRVLLTLGEHGAILFTTQAALDSDRKSENCNAAADGAATPVAVSASDVIVEASVAAAAPIGGRVVDTTGAGDCFRGVFAAAWAVEQRPAREAMGRAAAAAAVCVSRKGTLPSMPSRAEVEQTVAAAGRA